MWKWFSCAHPIRGGRAPFTLVHLMFDQTGSVDDGIKACSDAEGIPEADGAAGTTETVCSSCLEHAQHLINKASAHV